MFVKPPEHFIVAACKINHCVGQSSFVVSLPGFVYMTKNVVHSIDTFKV